jgi:hypothetical protein
MTREDDVTDPRPITFGVYAGSATSEAGLLDGPADDPARIEEALVRLRPDGRPFLVRAYVHYGDPRGRSWTPAAAERYARDGRRLDLALCLRHGGEDLAGWLGFVRDQLRRFGPCLATLQVTEEANVRGQGMDGDFPTVRRALVRGVAAAREEADRLGLDVAIGFNAAPTVDPADDFWTELGALGGAELAGALGYVGLDFFPDVFRPIPPDRLRPMVEGVLRALRESHLPAAGVPATVPIHVTEHGWPTGADRSEARQAEIVETVVRTVHERRVALNIAAYEHFALRDADSARPDIYNQFGLLRDDYSPKPAFETYRRLIAELG